MLVIILLGCENFLLLW